ncbi:RING finger protein 222 isoform 1-T3 [Spinachia spinachia]
MPSLKPFRTVPDIVLRHEPAEQQELTRGDPIGEVPGSQRWLALFYEAQPPPLEFNLTQESTFNVHNFPNTPYAVDAFPSMALYEEDSQQDAEECPVCYECLSGTERTLSCGHVFCHDCLVKTLVSINSDGNIRDTIVCPICRHLTFIKKQKEAVVAVTTDKDPGEGQTLEVPLPAPPRRAQGARRATRGTSPAEVNWVARCFGVIADRLGRQMLTSPKHTQIFVISAQGRPMAEYEGLSVVMTVVQPRRRRLRICTSVRCLLVLLSLFTIMALAAATLPWIFLV